LEPVDKLSLPKFHPHMDSVWLHRHSNLKDRNPSARTACVRLVAVGFSRRSTIATVTPCFARSRRRGNRHCWLSAHPPLHRLDSIAVNQLPLPKPALSQVVVAETQRVAIPTCDDHRFARILERRSRSTNGTMIRVIPRRLCSGVEADTRMLFDRM